MGHGLTASQLLSVWERANHAGTLEQGLALLAERFPERRREDLAELPVGRRDALLLDLRLSTFGAWLEAFARCPHCDEQVEFNTDVAAILAAAPPGDPFDARSDGEIAVREHRVRFRLPNTVDLATIASAPDSATAANQLLERCITGAQHEASGVDVSLLPADVRDAVARQMDVLDPLAVVRLNLSCPSCSTDWSLVLDPVTLLWREVAEHARGLLREVDALARAYAWREADILAMTPRRRRTYLEMVV